MSVTGTGGLRPRPGTTSSTSALTPDKVEASSVETPVAKTGAAAPQAGVSAAQDRSGQAKAPAADPKVAGGAGSGPAPGAGSLRPKGKAPGTEAASGDTKVSYPLAPPGAEMRDALLAAAKVAKGPTMEVDGKKLDAAAQEILAKVLRDQGIVPAGSTDKATIEKAQKENPQAVKDILDQQAANADKYIKSLKPEDQKALAAGISAVLGSPSTTIKDPAAYLKQAAVEHPTLFATGAAFAEQTKAWEAAGSRVPKELPSIGAQSPNLVPVYDVGKKVVDDVGFLASHPLSSAVYVAQLAAGRSNQDAMDRARLAGVAEDLGMALALGTTKITTPDGDSVTNPVREIKVPEPKNIPKNNPAPPSVTKPKRR
jgi:hypothetical protein